MEIDQTKSPATEDQMEMMMTMMTDKFPELYGPNYNDVVDDQHPSPTNYLSSTTTPANNPFTNTTASKFNPYFLDNPQMLPPNSFINPPPPPNNISFANTHSYYPNGSSQIQDHVPPPIDFLYPNNNTKKSAASMAAMREMIFRIAVMQPIHIDPESVKPPKRRNVKISKDPQSVAARHRRERISERIRILQRLVPGGTKMDTASMLDEAIHYVKFLKTQVQSLERAQVTYGNNTANTSGSSTKVFAASCCSSSAGGVGFPVAMSTGSGYLPGLGRGYHCQANSESFGDG